MGWWKASWERGVERCEVTSEEAGFVWVRQECGDQHMRPKHGVSVHYVQTRGEADKVYRQMCAQRVLDLRARLLEAEDRYWAADRVYEEGRGDEGELS